MTQETLIDILGWIGSVLIVGAYGLNISVKIKHDNPYYLWANLVCSFFFIINRNGS